MHGRLAKLPVPVTLTENLGHMADLRKQLTRPTKTVKPCTPTTNPRHFCRMSLVYKLQYDTAEQAADLGW